MGPFKKYNDNDLKHLQNVELMILKDVIDFCDKHNINYYMYAGSALGAIRHKGFIPWDDDIDIILFRKDFEKFLSLASKLDSKYGLLSFNQENYPYPFLKVFLKGTVLQKVKRLATGLWRIIPILPMLDCTRCIINIIVWVWI